jgi:hypothetical protein
MKLSELISYRNELNRLSTAEANKFTNSELSQFINFTRNTTLANKLVDINDAFLSFDAIINQIKQDLKLTIEEAERPWFQESYRVYEEEHPFMTVDHIFDERMNVHDNVKDLIKERLTLYVSWQHAGMFIRPGRENFINHLQSYEPLYILDQSYELMAPAMDQFNEVYRNRVRQYISNDITSDVYLEKIPEGQIGFCVAYMYFDYKPFEVIKQYFKEIFQKLKSGGVLAFTFNDCDYEGAVKLVESRFRCYTPGYLIKELAQSTGFEIVFDWHEPDGAITWLELRKPGTLTSIRGGQILAKILPK